jgi:hypothetical protein
MILEETWRRFDASFFSGDNHEPARFSILDLFGGNTSPRACSWG